MTDRPGPKPWFGCDTGGAAWKAYCEAWEHLYRRKPADLRRQIEISRGRAGLEALDHNIRVVRADYAGEFDDRTEIATRLKL